MARKHKNVPGQGTPTKLQFIGNVPTEETFRILYERYQRAYKAQKGKLRAGQTMYLLKRNYEEFKDYYLAVANETEPKEKETMASVANRIIGEMVEESRYKYSSKQARYLRKGLQAMDIEADLQDIKEQRHESDIATLLDLIDKKGKQLKAEGQTSYQIRHAIGVEFFGSPE